MILFFLKPCYAPLRAEMPPKRAAKKAKKKYFDAEMGALKERQKQEKESLLTLILNWFTDE